jgi:hypothetical protein
LYQGQAGAIGIADGVERLEKAQGLLEVEVGASHVCCAVVWRVLVQSISTAAIE